MHNSSRFRNDLAAARRRDADAFVASARNARRKGKRLQAPISVREPAKSARALPNASNVATIAAQQLSTISKRGTVLDVLDIYGLFLAVTFSRHFIF
ncbi:MULTISPECIES: hypothetical protein [Burkholderia]|uniref:hypothetical protein n=1 Tax=Burkholderia TaxID=32008 RepID=UPI000F5EC153|nr:MULTISPECIES: hypothetical protein [Burkholderia]MBY4869571.1 hypothetical protein [Burkholderia anthina]